MRGFLLAVLMLVLIIDAILSVFVLVSHAQEIGPTQRAYTISDPVREGALGLATLGGRYAISLGDGCTVAADTNVDLAPLQGFTGIAVIKSENQSWCMIRFEQQVSDLSCWVNLDGDCDIAAELAE